MCSERVCFGSHHLHPFRDSNVVEDLLSSLNKGCDGVVYGLEIAVKLVDISHRVKK